MLPVGRGIVPKLEDRYHFSTYFHQFPFRMGNRARGEEKLPLLGTSRGRINGGTQSFLQAEPTWLCLFFVMVG